MAEDNVLYFPVVLGIFCLQYQIGGRVLLRGLALGALLGIAMLINISLLVLVLALVPAAALVAIRDRRRALGIVVAIATAVALYYLPHVTGSRVALHEFLPKALGLEDFGTATAPLVSLERFELYRSGLRAIAVAPDLHQMVVPAGLRWTLLELLPWFVAACALGLGGTIVTTRSRELWHAALARIDLVATLAVGVVFPYFYEPFLIERWDVFWIGALFVLAQLLRKPTRLVVGIAIAMICAQSIGTLVTIGHHYGRWPDPHLQQARIVARDIALRNRDVVVLSYAIDRVVLADFLFRIGGEPRVFLVRPDGACFRVVFLGEYTVTLADVRWAVQTGRRPYIDPAVKL
jgi:hypothetical protein